MHGVGHVATLIDVGANIGQFSLLMRGLYPKALIYAFEPLSRPAGRFRRLFADDRRTTLYNCAIGPEPTSGITMYVGHSDDGSSLLPNRQASENVGTEQVEVCRLDDMLSVTDLARPAMLKLDVQGYELLALQSCNTLLKAIDFVFVEVAFDSFYVDQALADDVVQFLLARGFSFAGVGDPVFDERGKCMGTDFLFHCRKQVSWRDD